MRWSQRDISSLPSGSPHDSGDRGGQALPPCRLVDDCVTSCLGKGVVPRPAVRIRRPPLGGNPALSFELVQRGVQRALTDPQHVARHLPDTLCDRPAVHRLQRDRLQNQQVQRALDEIEARGLRNTVVCIDEIQKCPPLMDEVHLMIEERGIRFLLTGSSARALKRAGVNMLGGRGRGRVMHPFSWSEIRGRFSLDRALNHGLLPPHYVSDDPDEGLASYVDRYLTEEIAAEGLARNLPGFARFLQTRGGHQRADPQLLERRQGRPSPPSGRPSPPSDRRAVVRGAAGHADRVRPAGLHAHGPAQGGRDREVLFLRYRRRSGAAPAAPHRRDVRRLRRVLRRRGRRAAVRVSA